jgi:hypothetical protein
MALWVVTQSTNFGQLLSVHGTKVVALFEYRKNYWVQRVVNHSDILEIADHPMSVFSIE